MYLGVSFTCGNKVVGLDEHDVYAAQIEVDGAEYIAYTSIVEYQVLPRMAALAEVQWTSAAKDYPDFLSRLSRLRELYGIYGYNVAK